MRRHCKFCNREEPTYIFDPHCSKGDIYQSPYCVFEEVKPMTSKREVSTEVAKFQNDPIAWLQEWNQKNGKFSCEETELGGRKVFLAQLWVEGRDIALSTGVAPTLSHACINAIAGIDSIPIR